MQKQFAFFPGKLQVVFRKGPLGFLLQEPSDEAKRVSSTPQDKSAAMREDLVRQNALAVIRQRGGIPQIRWRCRETVSCSLNVQSEEAAGLCMADSHSKDSLQSFVSYALSFQEIQALLTYEAGRGDGVTASSEDDQLVGFGARAKSRWKEIWDSRGDGYADFVTGRRCVPGTRMSRLQQNLLKRQQPTTSSTPAEHPMKAPAEPLAMEEDVEMEREMLSIHNSDLQVQSYAMPVAAAALPRVPPGAKTVPIAPVPMPVPDHDMSKWICSQHQKLWMRTELQQLGLWPGSRPVHNPGNAISLWRLPPQPELLDMVAELPSPNFFQLHPFFIWKPESHIMVRLRNNDILPCLHSCPRPQVVSAGVGRPGVIVSVRGQYLIFSSRLCCKACRRNWSADNPPWVEKLPVRFTNLLPAFLTYKKLLQGTLGQVFRSDHTRKMARKVTLASGAMSSLAVMNENWLIVSWVMVQAETESDPELSEGIMYRDGGTLQLNHVAGEGAKVPVWIPVRGTSQQEGYHFQQAQWVTDMKKPGAVLPAVFDPASMWELNSASMAVTGQDKCPAFTSLTETLEKDVSGALPLPLKSSPRSARTGPMKTGGGVFVLDHTRWTLPMKDAIDSLLQYHHGDKDILRLVDPDYADMVHRSAADPNSLLRPTTRFHISRYVKHLAKLLNTSSSLNTSPEKLLETQQLWCSLTEGSKTTSVPVVTMETRQSFSRGSWRPPKSVWRTKLRDRSAVFSFMMASQMIFFHYRHPFSTQKTPRFPSCLREHVLPLPPCLNPRFSVSTFPFAILWVSER
ncbi:hypothetical protein D4764_0159570 [Takifugu flavidus]|uniref:DUF6729 domain-containing protein n=1 Tax=Takifugu flavidus TaxID=433684 RepID=A0A5C6MGT6_9TELE|nr:hypothetical protein D4764_0159570 [Takifugu flavidus]